MTAHKKKTTLYLDEETHRLLGSISGQKGQSASSVVRDALRSYFLGSRLEETVRALSRVVESSREALVNLEEYRLPEMKAEVHELTRQVQELNRKLNRLTEWIEIIAFWAATAVELFKVRTFHTRPLTDQEYDQFKKGWEAVHDRADRRIEAMTGRRVWKRQFDPTSL